MNEQEIREQLATVLSNAWTRVQWKDFTNKKTNSVDAFARRLRSSSSMQTFPQMMEKLCRRLNIASMTADTEMIQKLDEERTTVRRLLSTESVYIALMTNEYVKKPKFNRTFEEFQ